MPRKPRSSSTPISASRWRCWWWRGRSAHRNKLVEAPADTTPILRAFDLLRQPRFAFGALAIFVYVGAEVSIGSLLTNYLMQADTLALAARSAGELIAFYWGGAMVGRFIGAALLARLSPPLVLVGAALVAAALLLLSRAAPARSRAGR